MTANRNPMLVYGAGGHAKVVLDALRAAGAAVDILADDDERVPSLWGTTVVHPVEQVGGLPQQFDFIVAVGDNQQRAKLFERLQANGGRPQSVIHRNAVIAPSAVIGPGTLCCAGVVVNADAVIGPNVILNTSCSVDHDCRVGAHAHLCPGVRCGGRVTIGEATLVGLGSVILPGIRVGEGCVVGAGSVVTRDLPDGVVAYGAPARVRYRLDAVGG